MRPGRLFERQLSRTLVCIATSNKKLLVAMPLLLLAASFLLLVVNALDTSSDARTCDQAPARREGFRACGREWRDIAPFAPSRPGQRTHATSARGMNPSIRPGQISPIHTIKLSN